MSKFENKRAESKMANQKDRMTKRAKTKRTPKKRVFQEVFCFCSFRFAIFVFAPVFGPLVWTHEREGL